MNKYYQKQFIKWDHQFTDIRGILKEFTLMNTDNKIVYTMSYQFDTKKPCIIIWKDSLKPNFKAKNKLNIRYNLPYIAISYIKLSELGLSLEDIKNIGLYLSKLKPVIIRYKYKELMKFVNEKEV